MTCLRHSFDPQATVSPRTQSPVVATVITGTIIGLLAFFVPLETLADLVSMGTLFAFSVVTMSVAVRARYVTDRGIPKWRLLAPAAVVVAGSCMIAFTFYYQAHYGIIIAGACVFILGTLAFYTLPVVYRPEGFRVPLNPILPCLGTLANIFLIGEWTQVWFGYTTCNTGRCKDSNTCRPCVNMCSMQQQNTAWAQVCYLLKPFPCCCPSINVTSELSSL